MCVCVAMTVMLFQHYPCVCVCVAMTVMLFQHYLCMCMCSNDSDVIPALYELFSVAGMDICDDIWSNVE